jgi:hypothetical protein
MLRWSAADLPSKVAFSRCESIPFRREAALYALARTRLGVAADFTAVADPCVAFTGRAKLL